MAGDWIKMRADLHTHPKVVRISSALKADRLRVIGGLHAVWSLFDAHSIDGELEGYTPGALDEMIGWPGFAAAMIGVKWLEEIGESLATPRFDEHNGQSAKRRAQDSERKRLAREEEEMSAVDADKKRTREEKRREEKKLKAEEVPSSLSEADVAFEFPLNDGTNFQLSNAQVADFQNLYPAVDVDCALRACLGWNITNPKKRKTKSGILTHINTWLADKQNKPPPQARGSPAKSEKFDPVAHVNRNRITQ